MSGIQPPAQNGLINVSKVHQQAQSHGSLAQNPSTQTLSTINGTKFERKDYLVTVTSSEIAFSDPEGSNKIGLREFFSKLNTPDLEFWGDKIDELIALLFKTGVANSDWNRRIESRSRGSRFMVTCGNASYSLSKIIVQEESNAVQVTLVVTYAALKYADDGAVSTVIEIPQGKFRIENIFGRWVDPDGKEVKVCAPSQRLPSPNLQKLIHSQLPTKVQFCKNGIGIVSFTNSVLHPLELAHLDAVEAYSGNRKVYVPISMISPHKVEFELSHRQRSLADFQERYAHHVIVYPARFEEDITRVFQHHANKMLIPFSELWSDDDSDTLSDYTSIHSPEGDLAYSSEEDLAYLSEENWAYPSEGDLVKTVEHANPPELDNRVFAVLVVHPSRAKHQQVIAQLCLQHIKVIVCSEDLDTSWLPVKHVVYSEK
ncbi:hypothetical protein BDZ45DRAFT_682279 [Acephala macrosclerotiorum]|nr:hypothetical protein BDZ45DRAFT_682279 [Acephala macrosclerotiorum]